MANFKGGYVGQILDVDLTKGKITKRPLGHGLATKYIGSRGFVAKVEWDEVGPDVGPLDPGNVLIFATGPLTGTLSPSNGRFTIGAKSPETGIYGWGNLGGHWAPELKYAGYDMVLVRGRAKGPVYLWIDDDTVEIRDASHVWGKGIWDANKLICEDVHDLSVDMAAIGQAGENLVRIANIICSHSHSASKGLGAVMGSKKLKAIAVRGTNDVNVAEPEKFQKIWEKYMCEMMNDVAVKKIGTRLGTTVLLMATQESGGLGTRNFQSGVFEGAAKTSGEAVVEKYLMKTRGCFACPVQCDRFCVVRDGPYKGTIVGGPEFAVLAGFGSRLGNENLASILKANELCDLEYGLDTYGVVGAIGFAMELFEKGIINEKDTDGLALNWGNHEAIIEMVRKIGLREGFGNTLAEGVREAARIIGKGSEYYALEIKGAALQGSEDPRCNILEPYGSMLTARGADANCVWAFLDQFKPEELKRLFGIDLKKSKTKGIASLVKWTEDLGVAVDLTGECKSAWYSFREDKNEKLESRVGAYADMYSALTGLKMDSRGLIEAAQRVVTLERAYNIRDKGLTRKDDRYPERFLKEPMPEGPSKGNVFDPKPVLDEYYELRGWDMERGWPTKENYHELGLKDVYSELKKLGRY